MSLDQLDQALSGGGAPAAFNADTPVGTTVTGTVKDAEVRQLTDYVTGKPKTWDDGRPQMQVVITLATDQRDNTDDTGERRVFIKTWGVWKEALNQAIKAAGGTKASDVLTPGAVFTATFTGTKPSSMGSPMKMFEYQIKPPTTAGLDQALDTPTAAQAAPATAPAAPAATNGGAGSADQVKQLIAVGLGNEQIAAATGLDLSTVTVIRNVTAT